MFLFPPFLEGYYLEIYVTKNTANKSKSFVDSVEMAIVINRGTVRYDTFYFKCSYGLLFTNETIWSTNNFARNWNSLSSKYNVPSSNLA